MSLLPHYRDDLWLYCDQRYQLTQNTAGSIIDHHYTHNPAGNIAYINGIVEAVPVDGTTNYDDESNRLTETTGQEPAQYTYDDNGNVVSDGTRTFMYNQRCRSGSVGWC